MATRSGRAFDVRPARPLDLPALRAFLAQIEPEDLRFRFLSPFRQVPDGLIKQVLGNDHHRVEHFLASEPGAETIVASAVIAAEGRSGGGEVAICTHPQYKGLGLSWALLEHATAWADAHGFCEVIALEAIDHRDAIELEREQGFKADVDAANPGVVRMTKRLRKARR